MIAISTAYKKALIAYDIKGQQGWKEIEANHAHSENLLFSIDELLNEGQLKIDDNDMFCVVVGAGSFTGIRIGMALVKGLVAGGKGQKVVPVTTFDLMAYTYLKSKPQKDFVCVINALSGLVYVCAYDKNGRKIGEEEVIAKDNLSKYDNYDIVGLEEEKLGFKLVEPSAEDLLNLAKMRQDEGVDAKTLSPLYLRRSQAEEDLEKKLKNN